MSGRLLKNQSLSNLKHFVDSEELSDYDLLVGDEVFHVHRIVLACQSEYFRHIFSDRYYRKNHIALDEPVEPEIFRELLNYFYGQVYLTPENAEPLKDAAVEFGIKQLVAEIDHLLLETRNDPNAQRKK